MPGKTPAAAFLAFVEPLSAAIACVSYTKFMTSANGRAAPNVEHRLYLTGADEFVKVVGTEDFEFKARMKYNIIQDDRPGYGPYRVKTAAYSYTVRNSDHAMILAYHWHPTGLSHAVTPHLHIGTSQLKPDAVLSRREHVPTGRMTLETVVRTLVDLGVKPLCDDWSSRLCKSEDLHVAHRSWP